MFLIGTFCFDLKVHPNSSTKGRIVVAVYNYTSREAADLSFAKGDRMEVVDDRYWSLNFPSPLLFVVESVPFNVVCYFPSSVSLTGGEFDTSALVKRASSHGTLLLKKSLWRVKSEYLKFSLMQNTSKIPRR